MIGDTIVGMAGLPDINTLIVVPLLLLLIPLKSALFFWLFAKFKVSTFSATKSSLALANYSEFGLIVTMVAVSQQMIASDWLVIMAVLVASSFVLSSLINRRSNNIYTRFKAVLEQFQRPDAVSDEEKIDLNHIKVLVFGMGRVGVGAYDHLYHQQHNVLGLDFDEQVVSKNKAQGRKIFLANVTAVDFWSQLDIQHSSVDWILLCAPNIQANVATAKLARQWGFKGFISAAAQYADDEEELLANGINTVFNIYGEAGVGLAINGQQQYQQYQLSKN